MCEFKTTIWYNIIKHFKAFVDDSEWIDIVLKGWHISEREAENI